MLRDASGAPGDEGCASALVGRRRREVLRERSFQRDCVRKGAAIVASNKKRGEERGERGGGWIPRWVARMMNLLAIMRIDALAYRAVCEPRNLECEVRIHACRDTGCEE